MATSFNLGTSIAGGNGDRRKDDFYPTPDEATIALLPLIYAWPKLVWEPCCGNGAMSKVLESSGRTVISTDLVDRGYGKGNLDFFSFDESLADTIITNPPFNEAAKIIQHAKKIGVKHLALLLKIQFWNAAKRSLVWDCWQPSMIAPLTWRLDFTGAGAPTMDCMWCLWEGEPTETLYKPIKRLQ